MRAVVQRVSRARATPGGAIGNGFCVLLGVAAGDTTDDASRLARKTALLRIFPNNNGKFHRSLLDVRGAILVVSQFTLLASTRTGNRPSFEGAAAPADAEPLYRLYCDELRSHGVAVETGVFGTYMEIELVNDGPVTVVLESA